MLRRSVAKAFGAAPGGGARRDVPTRGPAILRSLAVDGIFEDLVQVLEGMVARLAASSTPPIEKHSPDEDSPRPTAGGASEASGLSKAPGLSNAPGLTDAPGPPLRLLRPRARLEGYEFVLEGPAGRLACTNTLRGFLRVRLETAGSSGTSFFEEELVAVERQGEAYRPIRKALPDPLALQRGEVGTKTPFRFTSVPELAREYSDRVLGR